MYGNSENDSATIISYYRPILLLLSISKVIERVGYKSNESVYFNEHNCITSVPYNYGLQKKLMSSNRSTACSCYRVACTAMQMRPMLFPYCASCNNISINRSID